MESTTKILKEIYSYVLPPEKINVSDWAVKYRIVSKEASARPGPWDNSLVPFAVEMMDSANDPDVDEITVWGSAQVSKTEVINNILAYFVDVDPSPILLVQPTLDMARAYSKNKLEYMIRDTPRINNKIHETSGRNKDATILERKFPGGFLVMVGGNSPSGLAQRSMRIIISDDIDRIPVSAGTEGDPVTLAEMRAESYTGISKKIRFSTATIKNKSRIERLYDNSDKRKYYVPCPECGHEQILVFDNMIWDKDHDLFGKVTKNYPETAQYACESCGALINDYQKYKMIANGKWIAEVPEVKHHRGYWINRLYSPFTTWEKIVVDYLAAKDDPATLQVFYNTSLAVAYEEEDNAESLDEMELMDRVTIKSTPDELLNNDILLLTCAVDVQKDRLEVLLIGWEEKKQSHRIIWQKLPGDTEQPDVWETLNEFLRLRWKRLDGIELGIAITVIDTGFRSQMVYEFIRKNPGKRFYAIKGVGGYGKPLLGTRSLVDMKRVNLYHIGTNEGKDILFSRLQIKEADKPKYIHFSKNICNADYFKQLASERLVKKRSGMIEYGVYEKKTNNTRNEILDLEVYNIAACEFLYPRFEKIRTNLGLKIDKSEEPEETSTKNTENISGNTEQNIKDNPVIPNNKKFINKIIRRNTNFVTGW